jgi:hypothetical protein
MRTGVLHLQCIVLQWTLCGRYCTADGQWYCTLNELCYNEHYVKNTAQQVDSCIVAWMECITVNIMWKVLHILWTKLFRLEYSVLTVNDISKVLHSSLVEVLYIEWSVAVNIMWKLLHSIGQLYCRKKCFTVKFKWNFWAWNVWARTFFRRNI